MNGQERKQAQEKSARKGKVFSSIILCICIIFCMGIILSGCDSGDGQEQTLTTGNRSITYSTQSKDVVIRTFYGGGLYGSFSLGPQVSIYGDGTYILGLERQGKLSSDELQKVLANLVDTHNVLNFKRQTSTNTADFKQQHFADMPDQNATFLELYLDSKPSHYELSYGTFGSQPQSRDDLKEYDQLGKALTTINEALANAKVQPYTGAGYALLVRPNFNPDLDKVVPAPGGLDFTLAQAAKYTCGEVPDDPNSPNKETGCLKYTIPQKALALTEAQVQTFKGALQNALEGTFQENGLYYTIVLRPLLPDEGVQKKLAMFGSSQSTYTPVELHPSGDLAKVKA